MKIKWITKLLILATALFAASASAGTWTLSGTTLTHDTSPWVLTVSVDGSNLTVTGNIPPAANAQLPLADPVDGGYTITDIGNYAFQGATRLTGTLAIPYGVTNIGNYAFDGCRDLTGMLTIPDSVTRINQFAFYGCSGITGLLIPNSVTTIGDNTFVFCINLTSVTVDGNISAGMFYFCSGLTNVTFGTNVTSIGQQAFYNCTGLTGITIPDNVRSLASQVFQGCTNLTDVVIGSSVNSIGANAFQSCTRLTNVTFNGGCPASVQTTIYNNANSVTTYVYGANLESWNSKVTPVNSLDDDGVATTWQGQPIQRMGNPILDVFLNPGTGGSVSPSYLMIEMGSAYGALPVPSRTGYTFDCWMDGATPVDSNTVVLVSHTLTAKWIANVYEVSFDSNGGAAVSPKNVAYGSEYGALPVPLRMGYDFIGWQFGGETVVAVTMMNTASNHTLVAQWSASTHLAVTFFMMDGSSNSVVLNQTIGEKFVLPAAPDRGGDTNYTFAGWFTLPGIDGTEVTTNDVVSADVTVLFAHWEFNGWQFVRVWDGDWLLNAATSGSEVSVLSVVDTPLPSGTVDFAKNVEYGYKFKTVGAAAFKGCTALTGVTLGDVVNINAEAFYNTSLTSISIDESLTICSNAFSSTPMNFILARSGAPLLTGNLIEEAKTVYYMPGNDDADWEGQFRSKHNNTVALRSSIDVATLTEDAAGFSFNIASTGLNDVPLDIKVYAKDSLTSTNDWVEVRTITGGIDGALFTDPASTNYPSRFYKTAVDKISG